MKTLIEIRNMSIGHGNDTLYKGVSFDICEGDCIMLCGANGSGKTTLMKTLAKTDDVVMIPTRIPKVKGFTLRQFVRISCYSHSDIGGNLSESQEAGLEEAINILGLGAIAERDISTLSDGEFQKAGIAAAIARKASVIMLDEPTAFLDVENRISVLNTLKSICQQGKAVIFSTHDLHDGLTVADKVIALGADREVHIGTEDLQRVVSTIFSRIPDHL